MRECKDVTGFGFAVKCKTEDGMICTLNEFHVDEKECKGHWSLPEYADVQTVRYMKSVLDQLKAEVIIYSSAENMLLKPSTIVRVWVELESIDCVPIM